jgi:hypothetical protein
VFKPKLVRRDKEGHFILIKRTICQEDITIVNIYAPNIGACNIIKQIQLDIKSTDRLDAMAHAYNPSYSRNRDQEDHGSNPAKENSS